MRPCLQPGCAELVKSGRCPRHAKTWRDDAALRGSSTERGIDNAWRKLRAQHVAREPLCVMCLREGKQTPTEIVDHIRPHRGDERLRLDPRNLQSLCRSHHAQKTAAEGAGYVARSVRR